MRRRPAALVAAAAVARAVVDLRAEPIGARRAEGGRRLRLDELLGVAAVLEVDGLVGDLHVPRPAVLAPDHLDVPSTRGCCGGRAAATATRRSRRPGNHAPADD